MADPTGFYDTYRNAFGTGMPSPDLSTLASNYGLDSQTQDYQKALSGQYPIDPKNGTAYVIQAMAAGDTNAAQQLMQRYGVTQDQVNSQLASTPGRNTGGLYGVLNQTVRPIGQYVTAHPAALFAAPFIAAGALGAFGGSLGAAGGAGAGTATGTASGTVSSLGSAAGSSPFAASGELGAGLGGAIPAGATAASGELGAVGAGTAAIGSAGASGVPLATGEGTVAGSLTAGADTLANAGAGMAGLGLNGWLNIGSTVAGLLGSHAAASAQSDAAQSAIDAQTAMYNQNRTDQAPWRQAGGNAVNTLADYYNPNSTTDYSKVISGLPGYQFQFDQGQQAVQRNLAARGLLNSGAAGKALTQYGQGMAQNYGQQYVNGLQSLAGLGQTATQATGQAGMNEANQVGNALGYQGNANASGYAGMTNAIQSGLGGLAGLNGMNSNAGMIPRYNPYTPNYYGGPN